jgi:hypothetical protein
MGKRISVVDPDVVARKVAAMSLGRAQAREAKLAAEAQLLQDVTSLDLEGLRRRASARQWLCALGEATGATEPEIARLVGLKGGAVSVHRLRKHPVTRRLVALIQDHQLQLVLKGEFGAQATAKAAAPEILSHMSELAGAQRERDGSRRGRAARAGSSAARGSGGDPRSAAWRDAAPGLSVLLFGLDYVPPNQVVVDPVDHPHDLSGRALIHPIVNDSRDDGRGRKAERRVCIRDVQHRELVIREGAEILLSLTALLKRVPLP